MKSWLYPILSLVFCLAFVPAFSQDGWPKLIKTTSGTEIRVFEFQPQSLDGNTLKLQSAVSLKESGAADPVFGMLWADAVVSKDRSGNITNLNSISIHTLKVPGVTANEEISELKDIIESELPKQPLSIRANDLQSQLFSNQKQAKLANGISTAAPKVIYSKKPSILVFIDGQPQLQNNPDWKVDQVVNTPFTLVKSNDQFYLYGNKKWFTSGSINGPWNYIMEVPNRLATIDKEVRKADTSISIDNTIPEVFVSTEPAELIQSKGEPNFAAVDGTNLLYMTNTNNDIFLDINSQQYYVLISGRWYKTKNMSGDWTFIPANSLPEDFAKIPEGSAKDAVLASIAGTPAAEESLLDAQIPQTAKVDRNTATANVDYDGEPQFENIEGTDLQYAVNTPGAVINDGRTYYYVENGVWFQSNNANGPWTVATQRPDGIENIPPSSPVYNVKYVYIYDATPEYVYMGYTPGYLGTYIYGPTVVYGTGYHYRPWRGRYYYARPVTWGFNMTYNPWSGWGFGISFGRGWFYSEFDDYGYYNRPYYGGCWGGWWGPTVYRPQYNRGYGSYYGRNTYVNNVYIQRSNRSNNVYRYRSDVVSYDRQRNEGSRYGRDSRNYSSNYDRNNSNNNNNGRLQGNMNTASDRTLGNRTNNNDRLSRFGTSRQTRFGNTNNNSGSTPSRMNQDNNNSNNSRGSFPGTDRQTNENAGTPNNGNGNFRRNRETTTQQGNTNQGNQDVFSRSRTNEARTENGNVNNGNVWNRNRTENAPATNSNTDQNGSNGNFGRRRDINGQMPSANQQGSVSPERNTREQGSFSRPNTQPSAPAAQPQREYTPQRSAPASDGGGGGRQVQRREVMSNDAPTRSVQQPQAERSESRSEPTQGARTQSSEPLRRGGRN